MDKGLAEGEQLSGCTGVDGPWVVGQGEQLPGKALTGWVHSLGGLEGGTAAHLS